MNLKYRRLLYLTFIAIFLVITPLVTLYTAGYRYNLKRHKIEKTGILYLDSKPKGAEIYINGRYQDKTPARFANLMPDTYQIEVKKTGYYPWKKEVAIKSNLTTFEEDIILFKENLPINLLEGQVNIFNIAPNQDKIIYSVTKNNSEELKLYNLINQSDFSIKKFNSLKNNQLEFVGWSPNLNKAILKITSNNFNQYFILDTDTLKIKELFDITRINFSKILWDNLTGNYLYGLNEGAIYQIDPSTNSTKNLFSKDIIDFYPNGSEIYYINQDQTGNYLGREILIKSPNTEEETVKIEKIKLPSPSAFTLQPSTVNYLVLLDQRSNDLFIISKNAFRDEDINQNIILQDRAKKILWSKDYKNILYFTDFEIWTYNFATQQKSLTTSYSEPIYGAIWYPTNKYIIYQLKDSIRAIEAGLSEIKNDLELAKINTIGGLAIDQTGNNLYFTGKAGNKSGIYQLGLQ